MQGLWYINEQRAIWGGKLRQSEKREEGTDQGMQNREYIPQATQTFQYNVTRKVTSSCMCRIRTQIHLHTTNTYTQAHICIEREIYRHLYRYTDTICVYNVPYS